MYRVLVVDDEKLERDGIRFLLSMEEGEWEIYEAANGKLALNELRKHPVDLMLTDIKMPHMDGLELSKKAREEYPDLEIIIFSGYGDFAFAQEAIRYGVTDYVLKPVDPDRFHDTIQKIQKEIASRKNKEQQSIKEKSFLQQYFLLGYIYSGDQERLKEAEGIVDFSVWEQWHCAILIESDEAFFDSASDEVPLEIREELRRSFFYLNLNGRQSLLLFKDVYCDYVLVAKNVYNLLKRLHPVRFHLAVSRRFDGYQELPEIMEQLEQQMEEKFLSSGYSCLYQRGGRGKKYRRRGAGFQAHGKNLRRYFQKGCEAAVEPFPQPGIQISVQYPVFGHVCEICFFQCDKGAVSGESFCRRAQAGSGGGSSVWLFYHSGDH